MIHNLPSCVTEKIDGFYIIRNEAENEVGKTYSSANTCR